MSTLDIYDDLVHRIYDAAFAPERLQAVLERICEVMQAPLGNLFSYSTVRSERGYFFTTFPAALIGRYFELASTDPHVRAAERLGLMREGVAVTSDQLVPLHELQTTSFYGEIWAPLRIRQMCGGVVFGADDAHHLPTVLSVHRLEGQPAFTDADRDLLGRLLTHLSRAMGVMFHLRDDALKIASSRAALDRLAAGVLLLDGEGRIVFENDAARVALDRGGPLVRTVDARFAAPGLGAAASTFGVRDRLARAVRRSLEPLDAPESEHFADAIVVDGADGRPEHVVHVAPLPQPNGFGTGSGAACAIVFLYDLAKGPAPSEALLQRSIGLTPAEARVASEIFRGGDVAEIAARLGIALPTARTHLRSIYEKAGVSRKADLLKLLVAIGSAR
jgi:DNA-binding CsgD family transcriptional regulator/PAS domain-containing protein